MKNSIIILLLFCFQFISCQDYGALKKLEHLPETLHEISGMETIDGSDVLIAVNDSGNKSIVYIYDKNTGLYSLKSDLLKNKDWEDLSIYVDKLTGKTLLYVGDTGNNDNKRRDLVIYEIDITDLKIQNQEIQEVKRIPFNYKKQKKFPPKKKEYFYDCEAFVRIGDYFYLFSKNRSKDFNGKTQVYRLKVDGSSNVAEYLTQIEICNDSDDCLVTGADVNSKGEIALLTGDKVFIISDYDMAFKDFNIKRYNLNYKSQKESITFKEDNLLWISDEQTKNKGGNLYELYL